ncbi:tape measure protein [Pasteurella multocida]
MSGSLWYLNIQLALDQAKFQSNLEKAQRKAKQFSERTTQYLNNIEKAAQSINNVTKWQFRGDIANLLGSAAQQAIRYADAHTELENRIKLVIEGSLAQSRAIQSVYDISLKTSQSVEATSRVYSKFSQSANELGLTQSEVARLTETVNKTIALSGVSATSAEAGLLQFSQALDKGRLSGQELSSVMTQTPALAKAIADGLGVPVSALKELGEKGELTPKKVIGALQKMGVEIDHLFKNNETTLSSAFVNLNTAAQKWVGEINSGLNGTKSLAVVVNGIANNFDDIAKSVGVLGALGVYASARPKLHKLAEQQKVLKLAKDQQNLEKESARLLAQTTQANYAKAKSEYDLAKAEVANIQYARQQIVTERELLTTRLQSATSQTQRSALTSQILELRQQELAMTKLQTAAEQQVISVRQGVRLAYAENAVAQSAYQAGLVKTTLTTRIFQQVSMGVRNELNALKLAFLSNPLGLFVTALTTVGSAYLLFSSSADKAKDELSDFNAEVELSTDKLNKMNQAQLEAAKIKLERKIEAQREEIEKLNKEYEILRKESLEKTVKEYDGFAGVLYETEKSQQELNNQSDEAKLKLGLISDKIAELTKNQEKLNEVLNRSASIGLSVGADSSEKVLKVIEQAQHKIGRNKLKGKDLAEFDARFDLKGFENDPRYQEALDLLTKANLLGSGKSGGKTDYTKQFTDQVSQLQQRLAELKANAKDIKLFGEVSQYQEVNKLSQDIVFNAEKYAHFGIEGVTKLKEMASAIDSENQKIAIAQFGYDNSQKLQSMEFELTLLGKTRQEQDLIRFNNQLDIEAAKLKIGMSQENIIKLDEEIAKLKERHEIIHKTMNENRGSAIEGIKQGMKTIEEDVSNVAGNIANVTTNAFSGMSNALTDLVMTGKANFADMAKAIIKDIIQMTIRMMLFKAISSTFGGFSGGGSVGGIGQHYRGGLVSFDNGGFTGLGGKYTPAGIVHRGEYVITKEATSRIGLDYLNYLNYGGAFGGKRGFSSGGGVSVPRLPTSSFQPNTQPNISVKVINNGEPAQANVSTKQKGGQLELTIELVRNIAKQEASEMIQTNFRPGGAFS